MRERERDRERGEKDRKREREQKRCVSCPRVLSSHLAAPHVAGPGMCIEALCAPSNPYQKLGSQHPSPTTEKNPLQQWTTNLAGHHLIA